VKPDDLSKLRIERAPAAAPRLKHRWGKLALIGVVVVAGAAFAFTRFASPVQVETVTVSTVYPSLNFTLLNATGYVVPQRKAALSSKATGRLEWLGVLEGSRVKAGEVIARLESNDVKATLDQAEAQVNVAIANQQQGAAELKDAEANYKRSSELLAKKFISSAQHDTDAARLGKARAAIASQKAAVASAEANRRSAEVGVEQTLIRAPFDAIVLTKNANVGDNITPFSSAAEAKGAVVTVADMETLEVEADVAESSIAKIVVDQPCEVQLDALPEIRLAAMVSRVVPTVDRSKATVLVKVRFVERDPRVLPDMSAKVAFLSRPVKDEEKKPVTAVQSGAIVERDGKKAVFTVKDDHARLVAVQTGGKVGDLVEIKGVKAGERLILAPTSKVQDGTAVQPLKK
jgi:RND family efflux transporter MFP subunit